MALPTSFRAWTYASFSGKLEDSLELQDVSTPKHFLQVKQGKVLIEVLASSLNPADYKIPESPIESRVVALKKPASPSLDFCGRLVSQPDQIVCGRLAWPDQFGTLSQYILVSDNDFADVPEGVDILQAATLGVAPLTAYQSLEPFVKAGDRVLVNGGSGGVGTFTIQMAKLFGCHVVAVCSSRNAQLCRDLGADEIVDYAKGDIVEQLTSSMPFDVLIDNVGNDPTLHKRSDALLKHTGRFVSVSAMLGSFQGISSMLESIIRPAWLGGASSKYTIVLCQSNKEQLQQIVQWVADQKLRVIMDEVFNYADAQKAFAKLRSGRARGKIVVRGSALLDQ